MYSRSIPDSAASTVNTTPDGSCDPCSSPVRNSSPMPPAFSCSASAASSMPRPSRLCSCTTIVTAAPDARISRARATALSSSGRVVARVEISDTPVQTHPLPSWARPTCRPSWTPGTPVLLRPPGTSTWPPCGPYRYALRQHLVADDSSAAIERRRLRRDPDRRVIPARQLESLWPRADLPVREKTLWRLLYDTAARTDEILGLDIGDLDLQNKTATVTGKGGITRQVNWYTHTAHLLPRIIGGRTRGPLFLANRRPRRPIATLDLDPATGRARLSYRRAAECFTTTTGWTLHQLRHTRTRELKDDNCPLPVLQKITGHRSLRTLTEHYPGPSTETVRAWYENTDPDARRRRGSRA